MATNNFYSKSGKYFTLAISDDSDGEFEIEDTCSNIAYALREIDALTVEDLDESDDELRSYPGKVFAGVTLKNSREDIYPECKIVARSGYYSGVNFDPVLALYNAGTGEYIELEDLTVDEIIEAGDLYHGRRVSSRAAEATKRRLIADYAKLQKSVEKILDQYTVQLEKVGQFSNGEAVYRQKEFLRG